VRREIIDIMQQDRSAGHGAAALRMVRAERNRYRTALGVIQQTASTAEPCPCYRVVARAALDALTPPTNLEDWLRGEA